MIDHAAMAIECGKCDAEGWHERLKSDGALFRAHTTEQTPWPLALGYAPLVMGKCGRCTSALTIRAALYHADETA